MIFMYIGSSLIISRTIGVKSILCADQEIVSVEINRLKLFANGTDKADRAIIRPERSLTLITKI